MLVAPLALFEHSAQRPRGTLRHHAVRAVSRTRGPAAPAQLLVVYAWFAIGLGVLLCVPVARGSVLLGATVPFWLIVAPLVNLVWIKRDRVVAAAAFLFACGAAVARRDTMRNRSRVALGRISGRK